MTFETMVAELKKCPTTLLRTDSENYLEIVVRVDKLEMFYPILERFFGKTVKAAGQEVLPEIEELTDDFGGVRKDQTLYSIDVSGVTHLGMIWPWMDNVNATIKLYRLRKK